MHIYVYLPPHVNSLSLSLSLTHTHAHKHTHLLGDSHGEVITAGNGVDKVTLQGVHEPWYHYRLKPPTPALPLWGPHKCQKHTRAND